MDNVMTGNEKIGEALRLLNEAAKDKKAELQGLLSDKYQHLKGVIVEAEGALAQGLAKEKKCAQEWAAHARAVGAEKAKAVATEVNEQAHRNPWPYVAGAAVGSLLLGYILGRNRQS